MRYPTLLVIHTPTYSRSRWIINVQVTRWFLHFSIYAGEENLTNFRQKNPIVNTSDPWSSTFDPTVVWGPISGAMGYLGVRFNF